MNGRALGHESISVWRHYDAALESAALIAAISRARFTDREPLYALLYRCELHLIDLLHDFAYNGRRAIELAEEYEVGIIDHAKGVKLPGFGETHVQLEIMEESRPLADQSVWWVLGRIIHSRSLTIHYFEDPEVGTEWARAPNITEYRTPIAFAVRSDYDGLDERHYAKVESLVAGFLALRGRFAKALVAAGAPVSTHWAYL